MVAFETHGTWRELTTTSAAKIYEKEEHLKTYHSYWTVIIVDMRNSRRRMKISILIFFCSFLSFSFNSNGATHGGERERSVAMMAKNMEIKEK